MAWADSGVPLIERDLRDVKGPVSFSANYGWLWLILIAAVMAAIIFGTRYWWRKKQREPAEPVDPRLPWQIACDELAVLETSKLLDSGQFKEYYSRMSGIIRRYFERRFHVRAPEMTTEEFLRSLEHLDKLSDTQKSVLQQFLNSCDVVKFAKHTPAPDEARESLCWAKELIEQTKQEMVLSSYTGS